MTRSKPSQPPRLHLPIRSSSIVFIGLGLLVGGFGLGCSSSSHIDSDIAHSYRTSVQLGAIERGWNQTWVGRLIDQPRIIQHKIEVQADLAGDLVRMSGRERREFVGPRACPQASHPIWQQLHNGHDVQVELATEKNGAFATVSCRSAVL